MDEEFKARKLVKEEIEYLTKLETVDQNTILTIIGRELSFAELGKEKGAAMVKAMDVLNRASIGDLVEKAKKFYEKIKEELKKTFCGESPKYDWCKKGSKDLDKIKDLVLLILGGLGIAMPWTLILAVIVFLIKWALDDLCGCKAKIA